MKSFYEFSVVVSLDTLFINKLQHFARGPKIYYVKQKMKI